MKTNHMQGKYLYIKVYREFKHEKEQLTTPLVKLNIDNNQGDDLKFEVFKINSNKRIVSKHVEVITKIIIQYEDGTKKEIEEKESHTFQY